MAQTHVHTWTLTYTNKKICLFSVITFFAPFPLTYNQTHSNIWCLQNKRLKRKDMSYTRQIWCFVHIILNKKEKKRIQWYVDLWNQSSVLLLLAGINWQDLAVRTKESARCYRSFSFSLNIFKFDLVSVWPSHNI